MNGCLPYICGGNKTRALFSTFVYKSFTTKVSICRQRKIFFWLSLQMKINQYRSFNLLIENRPILWAKKLNQFSVYNKKRKAWRKVFCLIQWRLWFFAQKRGGNIIYIYICSKKFSHFDAGVISKPNIFKSHIFLNIDLNSYQDKILIYINNFFFNTATSSWYKYNIFYVQFYWVNPC